MVAVSCMDFELKITRVQWMVLGWAELVYPRVCSSVAQTQCAATRLGVVQLWMSVAVQTKHCGQIQILLFLSFESTVPASSERQTQIHKSIKTLERRETRYPVAVFRISCKLHVVQGCRKFFRCGVVTQKHDKGAYNLIWRAETAQRYAREEVVRKAVNCRKRKGNGSIRAIQLSSMFSAFANDRAFPHLCSI